MCGVRADEPGRAGHEKFHEGLSVRTRSLKALRSSRFKGTLGSRFRTDDPA
jgi:hypothetical protein